LLSIIHLTGSPYAMGCEYGRKLRDQVHQLAEERLRLSLLNADTAGRPSSREACLALAARLLPVQARYDADVHAEFMGIAEGAAIAPELLLIGNGYTDFRDVLMGAGEDECTMVRTGGGGGEPLLCAQTWDMHTAAEQHVVLVHRRPDGGPATLSLTTAGCLSLVGLNAAGLAVGNTNLVPTDPRLGVVYLAMIHRALAARTWDEAIAAITAAPRASGHHYWLADADGQAAGIETTGGCHQCLPADGDYAHTNHYLAAELQGLAAPLADNTTTYGRLARAQALLAALPRPATPSALWSLLSDHEGPKPICVHADGPNEAKTCGAVVLQPATREMWVRVGNPCAGAPERVALGDLGT